MADSTDNTQTNQTNEPVNTPDNQEMTPVNEQQEQSDLNGLSSVEEAEREINAEIKKHIIINRSKSTIGRLAQIFTIGASALTFADFASNTVWWYAIGPNVAISAISAGVAAYFATNGVEKSIKRHKIKKRMNNEALSKQKNIDSLNRKYGIHVQLGKVAGWFMGLSIVGVPLYVSIGLAYAGVNLASYIKEKLKTKETNLDIPNENAQNQNGENQDIQADENENDGPSRSR